MVSQLRGIYFVVQIKMMTNIKKGKDQSRGIAFVDFTEHQHALVALRVLNNNPGIKFFLPRCQF